jgi:hypothetical protein
MNCEMASADRGIRRAFGHAIFHKHGDGPSGNSARFCAVDTLLGLARSFLSSFELPSLAAQTYAERVDSTSEMRFLKPEVRCQVLLEQLPGVTFMAAFEQEGLRGIYASPQIETL